VQLFDANDTRVPVLGCTEGEPLPGGAAAASSCAKLYDNQKEPASALFSSCEPRPGAPSLDSYAWNARGTGRARVTLDLGGGSSARAFPRIVIYMTALMRDALVNVTTESSSALATVDVFLSAEPVPAGSLSNSRLALSLLLHSECVLVLTPERAV
jgi:hypothetical protein